MAEETASDAHHASTLVGYRFERCSSCAQSVCMEVIRLATSNTTSADHSSRSRIPLRRTALLLQARSLKLPQQTRLGCVVRPRRPAMEMARTTEQALGMAKRAARRPVFLNSDRTASRRCRDIHVLQGVGISVGQRTTRCCMRRWKAIRKKK